MRLDNKNFTWAPLVPLIGGFPLGVEQAFNKAPEEVISYAGIINDDQYNTYNREVLKRDIPYTILEDGDYSFDRKINVIVGTPPCSGLSSLNSSRNERASGVNADANRYMYMIFKHGMLKYDADVVVIENAPALATNRGIPVANNLFEICRENGYSLTLYKTSTHFHGIPQRRDRTFAIAWKSKTSPVMEWQQLEHPRFDEYILDVPGDALQQDLVINPDIISKCAYWQYLKANVGDPRELIEESRHKSCLDHIRRTGELEQASRWIKENGTERQAYLVEHAIKKFGANQNVWDGSINVYFDRITAFVGRNITDAIHPKEDRSLTVREGMHLMGMPHDMELQGGLKNINMVAQNVPVCTARFIGNQIKKFLVGNLEFYNNSYVKQDNWNGAVEFRDTKEESSLEDFI